MKIASATLAFIIGCSFGVAAHATGTRPNAWLDDLYGLPVGIITGRYLIGACQSPEPPQLGSSSWCLGYIESIRDSMYVDEKLLCGGIEIFKWEKLRVLVLGYLYRHPEMQEKHAGMSVKSALNEAFPCK